MVLLDMDCSPLKQLQQVQQYGKAQQIDCMSFSVRSLRIELEIAGIGQLFSQWGAALRHWTGSCAHLCQDRGCKTALHYAAQAAFVWTAKTDVSLAPRGLGSYLDH